jgi:hypothetical protein
MFFSLEKRAHGLLNHSHPHPSPSIGRGALD